MADFIDIKVRIKRLTISDGSYVDLEDQAALVIVGPNNAGKSRFLRDIEALAARDRSNHADTKVVLDLTLNRPSNPEIYSALQKYYVSKTDSFISYSASVHKNAVSLAFNMNDDNEFVGQAAQFFCQKGFFGRSTFNRISLGS